MAEAYPSLGTEINTCIECELCLEEITDPKVLPCQHSFCCKCIMGVVECNPDSKYIPCPLCREEWEVPSDGPTGLKTNLTLRKLLSIKRRNVERRTSEHMCTKHIDEKLKAFCNKDKMILCYECIAKNHSGHDFIEIGQAAELHEQELRNDIEASVQTLRKRAEVLMVQKDLVRIVQTDRLKVKAAMEKEFSAILESIAKHHDNYPFTETDENLQVLIATEESKLSSLDAIKSKGQSGQIEMIKMCETLKQEGFPNSQYAQPPEIMSLGYKPPEISKGHVTFGELTLLEPPTQVPLEKSEAELHSSLLAFQEIAPEQFAHEECPSGQLDTTEITQSIPGKEISPRQPVKSDLTSEQPTTFELIGPGQTPPAELTPRELSSPQALSFLGENSSYGELSSSETIVPFENSIPLGSFGPDQIVSGQNPDENIPDGQQHTVSMQPAQSGHFEQTSPQQTVPEQPMIDHIDNNQIIASGKPAHGEPLSDQFDSLEFAWRIEPDHRHGQLTLTQLAPKQICPEQHTPRQCNLPVLIGPRHVPHQLEDLSLGQFTPGELSSLSKEDLESLVQHNLISGSFDLDTFAVQLEDPVPRSDSSGESLIKEPSACPPSQGPTNFIDNNKETLRTTDKREDSHTKLTVGKLPKERLAPFEKALNENGSEEAFKAEKVDTDAVSNWVASEKTTADKDIPDNQEKMGSAFPDTCAAVNPTTKHQTESLNVQLASQETTELAEPDIYTSSGSHEQIQPTDLEATAQVSLN